MPGHVKQEYIRYVVSYMHTYAMQCHRCILISCHVTNVYICYVMSYMYTYTMLCHICLHMLCHVIHVYLHYVMSYMFMGSQSFPLDNWLYNGYTMAIQWQYVCKQIIK